MSLPYATIIRTAAVKVSAVVGRTKTELETNYLTSPLTTTQIGTVNFTKAMISDLLIGVVGKIIRAYAFVPSHPFRNYNITQTDNIAYKALIPSVDSNGDPILGVYGAIRDGSTGDELTEQPSQIIQTIVDNTDNALKGSYFYYKIIGERLAHTRPNAIIDVVTFNASDQLDRLNANEDSPLPDSCLDLAWTGLCASLFLDEEFMQQAAACSQYFERGLVDLASGKTAFLPGPDLQSTQSPAIS